MTDDYPNRALWLRDTLETIHDSFARVWLWGFSLVVLALFAVVLNELALMGRVDRVGALVRPFQVMVVIAVFMAGVWFGSLLAGVVGWLLERGDES
ncbi:hypothetical protein KM295_14230 [Natronomonas sp. F2-12]|uniref:Uncharacterized protein n=1 Tax=Natronomonas aquatica TaxID=2841590 RepID=A0A9R1CSN5_9EURY|nr:hypothetical protein [Natronomonas aquatica]MCQ4334613.1 hypothetical protein [Natronomonas aquatica]